MLTAAATIQISDHPDRGDQQRLAFQWQNVQFEPALQDDTDALAGFYRNLDFLGQASLSHHRCRRNVLEISGDWM